MEDNMLEENGNDLDINALEKEVDNLSNLEGLHNEASKPDGSEFFHHGDKNADITNFNDATSSNNASFNNVQQSVPKNFNNNPNNDENSSAVKDALNKKDKNKKNKFGDSDSSDSSDNKNKKSDKKGEKKSDSKDKKDDKKGGKTKESSALQKAQNKSNNMGRDENDLSEKSDTDEEMDKLGRGAAKAGDKALTLGKKGFKAIFDRLPFYGKLIVILVVLLLFVVLLIVMALSVTTMAYEGAMGKMCNSKITYNSQELAVDDYIKGTIYNKMINDTSVIYSDDYIKSYAIYVRSIVYDSFLGSEDFQTSTYPFLVYSDYTSIEDENLKNTVINMTSLVDETTKQYIEEPKELTDENINLIYTLSEEGKTYDEILKELSQNPDYFEIRDDLDDFCTKNSYCRLTDGQSISVPHTAPESCRLQIQGECQCAMGVYEYMEHILLADKPDLWQDFQSMRSKYGVNAADYYEAALAGDIFPSSKDPAPGDIWAYANGSYNANGKFTGSSQHVFVVLDVVDDNTIEVYECNFGGNELCKIWQRDLNSASVQQGLFIHILGECI